MSYDPWEDPDDEILEEMEVLPDEMPPGMAKKALPKGADPEDFIKYMEECVFGDLPCVLCLKGSSSYFTNEQVKAGDVPWYKCGHAFIYGPLTPMKKVIMSKIKTAQKAAKKAKAAAALPLEFTDEEATKATFKMLKKIMSASTAKALLSDDHSASSESITSIGGHSIPTLSFDVVDFLNLAASIGPDDESFLDPQWEHCDDSGCDHCSKHALHHGLYHEKHNKNGIQTSIWQQCINKFGDEDADGMHITFHNLMAWWGVNSISPPHQTLGGTNTTEDEILEQMTTVSMGEMMEKEYDDYMSTNKPVYKIVQKARANRIMKSVKQFDQQWFDEDDSPSNPQYINMMRTDWYKLRDFLTVLVHDTTKKERATIIPDNIERLLDLGPGDNRFIPVEDGEDHIETDVVEYALVLCNDYKRRSGKKEAWNKRVVNDLTYLIARVADEAIDHFFTNNDNLGPVHTVNYTGDARGVMNRVLNNSVSGYLMQNIFVMAYLTYDGGTEDSQPLREATTDPLSQKARGIQAISTRTGGRGIFKPCPALHIALETALRSTIGDLQLSIARAFHPDTVRKVLSKGLYIRTCPQHPRPGVLPNVLATTVKQFADGVEMLARCMLDPDHDDYDPQGCLIVQRYIKPVCSGVMVRGGNSFIIGPSNDGVTAGGGTNIIFTLNPMGQRSVDRVVRDLRLDDGMEHHEIEFVYEQPGSSMATKKTITHYKKVADQRHHGESMRIIPHMTQMRGLLTPKEDLVPPPMVNGEPLHIRGNVPQVGVVEQRTSMDVERGELTDCFELEQMAKRHELPDGLVVYCSAGTSGAHVGGLSLDYGFPVVYGMKPRRNGTIWTEIKGWVTDVQGATPEPYDPQSLVEFYKIGLKDGDRYWTYNLAPLSQFFHNFINGPINDPRLEGYLAGVFTSWIIKAALGVSMGEFRHGIGSRAPFSPHTVCAHIGIQLAISGESGVNHLWQRGEYYKRLNYNELGYDTISSMAQFYTEAFDPDMNDWASNSYGGVKYWQATEPTTEACNLIQRLLNGEDIRLNSLLNSVNKLENAVHNTGFFFNKFLDNKDAFDIGTGGHYSFASACEHWIVTAPFYALFYTNYVDEPHRIAKGHESLVRHLETHKSMHPGEPQVPQSALDRLVWLSHNKGLEIMKREKLSVPIRPAYDYFKKLTMEGRRMHTTGRCGIAGCQMSDCMAYSVLDELGLDEDTMNTMLTVVKRYHNHHHWMCSLGNLTSIESIENEVKQRQLRAMETTVFTETEREVIETPVSDVMLLKKLKTLSDQDDMHSCVWSIDCEGVEKPTIYLDHILYRWQMLCEESLQETMDNEDYMFAWEMFIQPQASSDLYIAWKEAKRLDRVINLGEYTIKTHILNYTPKSFKELLRGLIKAFSPCNNISNQQLLIMLNEHGDLENKIEEMKQCTQ